MYLLNIVVLILAILLFIVAIIFTGQLFGLFLFTSGGYESRATFLDYIGVHT